MLWLLLRRGSRPSQKAKDTNRPVNDWHTVEFRPHRAPRLGQQQFEQAPGVPAEVDVIERRLRDGHASGQRSDESDRRSKLEIESEREKR